MKHKLIGIIIGMLFIASALPAVSAHSDTTTTMIPYQSQPMVRDGWSELQKLLAADGAPYDFFGYSVSLSGDTLLIGAMGAANFKGAAYVFSQVGTSWNQQAEITVTDGIAYDYFGYSVSLYGDTALIGAQGVNGGQGAAYVYTRTGATWTQQAKLLADDGVSGDNLGCSVSLVGDTALIGALGVNSAKGAAYVFTRSGTTWTQQAKLLATDGQSPDNFGTSVSLSGDTALVGASGQAGSTGASYIFIRSGTTWTQQAKLLATGGLASDYFGCSVSLRDDAALVGASGSHGTGQAFVFTRSGTTWTQQANLSSTDGMNGDGFGCSVSLSDDNALIGSLGSNGAKGAAYVFEQSGTAWSEEAKLFASDAAPAQLFGNSVSLDGTTCIIGAEGDASLKGAAYVFFNEQPPAPPTIQGPSSGKAKQQYNFTFTSTDPNGDNVFYYIEWGDNTTSGWLGPYASGVTLTQPHSWATKGTYTIKAKAKDTFGNESDWGTLTVTMPLSYTLPQVPFFAWLFQRFPHAFPLLRHLMGC